MTDKPVKPSDDTQPLKDADDSTQGLGEFEHRLQAIESKAKAARQEHAELLEPSHRQKKLSAESAKGLGFGLAVAYTIVGVPLVMVAIGWWIDRITDSNVFLFLFALIGSVLGIVVAVALVNRQNVSK